MRTIKLSEEDANKMYEMFQRLIFARVKALVDRYVPRYSKDLKMGKDSEYITCGGAFIEPTKKTIRTISGFKEVAAWAVGHADEVFHDLTYVEEGTNMWSDAARKFVLMLIKDDMRQMEDDRIEFAKDSSEM
jgi:hypothetical protein